MPHMPHSLRAYRPFLRKQKGKSENPSGLLQEFYPKGKNLSRVSPATLKRYLSLIDAVPKKVLQRRTPQE